ncbi:hypothetical protein ACT7C6_30055 [Bacillus paranthracis]
MYVFNLWWEETISIGGNSSRPSQFLIFRSQLYVVGSRHLGTGILIGVVTTPAKLQNLSILQVWRGYGSADEISYDTSSADRRGDDEPCISKQLLYEIGSLY